MFFMLTPFNQQEMKLTGFSLGIMMNMLAYIASRF